ncbi:unnamed protein product [Gordionus sp. m RMFG-2023]|uniref:putative sodium-coupled neutral amino acid transporter 11 n=1 Tax=Gordionus sp. m RMFG-2023 TaxID=3053472 RepID=UPI0030E2A5BD
MNLLHKDKSDERQALVNEVEEENEENHSSKKTKNNLVYVSFNFINSIVGSGIIGMPYAIKKSGIGLGIIFLLLVAFSSDYSLVLLVKGGQLAGTSNYQDLVLSSFGKIGFFILSIIQFIYPFIAIISYNVIIGDTIPKVLRRLAHVENDNILGNRYFIVFLASVLVTLPLSLSKDIGRLAKISLASLCCVLFLLIVIISRAITLSPSIPATKDAWIFANNGIIESLGIMVFAFMCHHNSFLLYDSLDNPTQSRWNLVTHFSVFISALVTLMFGVIGYVIFTGYTEGDILENFCKDDDLINITRFIYTVTIMLTYPIECFVCREVIERVLFSYKTFSLQRHITITGLIVLFALLISYSTDCLGIVLEINGVITATPLAFILPAMCYIKLYRRSRSLNKDVNIITSEDTSNDSSSGSSLIFAWCTLLFGAAILVVGFISIIIHLYKGVFCSHGHELFYCLKK